MARLLRKLTTRDGLTIFVCALLIGLLLLFFYFAAVFKYYD
ncbi:MAG: hypothetical protein ACRD50_11725 [Candidatus Acidiferrales bacterium]